MESPTLPSGAGLQVAAAGRASDLSSPTFSWRVRDQSRALRIFNNPTFIASHLYTTTHTIEHYTAWRQIFALSARHSFHSFRLFNSSKATRWIDNLLFFLVLLYTFLQSRCLYNNVQCGTMICISNKNRKDFKQRFNVILFINFYFFFNLIHII